MCFAFGIIQHSEYNHNIKDIYVTHPDWNKIYVTLYLVGRGVKRVLILRCQ